jgi:hypothetical protein
MRPVTSFLSLLLLLVAATVFFADHARAITAPSACVAPIREAERTYGMPDGLLMAIGRGEAGRYVKG